MKKKQHDGDVLKCLRKMMRIMRLSLFLIIISSGMAFSANSYSQNTKLTVDLNNATVKDVLKAIENQSEFLFFYQEKHVDLNRQVTLHATDKDVEAILDHMFEGTDNTYVINDRQIVIGMVPKKELGKHIQNIKGNVKPVIDQPQQKEITGKVTDTDGLPLPGVSVVVKGTTTGTVTNNDGEFSLDISEEAETLQFSFVGMRTQEVTIEGRTTFTVTMDEETVGVDEVVVVGYGVQKRSDVTGAVASVSQERLEMTPSINVNQIIQGSVPGVIVQTSAAGASPNEVLMVRGRNSIAASNTPLIVVDGIPYAGALNEINPKDISSINVLKDASAAAIYGSRGSNGVIIITTKEGGGRTPRFSYDGRVGLQNFVNVPDIMDGEEFYNFKLERCAECLTQAEEEIYNAREWEDWPGLGLRQGFSQEHILSVSGGLENTQYYLSGSLLDVQGIAKNDDFKRISGRVNISTDIFEWISVGTRSQFTYSDRSGVAPSTSQLFYMNPLTRAYNEDGSLAVYPWPEDQFFANPLSGTLFDNVNETFQLVSNNFAEIEFPFIPGLSYRLNTGITFRFGDNATYRGRDTKVGLEARGSADLSRSRLNTMVVENILTYNKEIGIHNFFLTGVYSYVNDIRSTNSVSANVFPHDFVGWHAIGQAELIVPSTFYNETHLVSQMIRLNYVFDKRYLLTLTGRRDGFSGFGADNKWGLFPSASLAWNLHNESFFTWNSIFSELKPRISYGLNGNQAVGAYQYIARLGEYNMVSLNQSVPGYRPATLANEDLGWESSRTLNLGVDFGILEHRISGDFNIYHTNTTDLLLQRA
ncbi:MAG: SusC/RagA family TonB-linked outer membrane protein, partial [Bacteroidota bacterium]